MDRLDTVAPYVASTVALLEVFPASLYPALFAHGAALDQPAASGCQHQPKNKQTKAGMRINRLIGNRPHR